MEYIKGPELVHGIRELNRKGGRFKRASDQVLQVIGRISTGEDPLKGLALTNHGESRIDKCVKYDLTGRCRLITIQDSGYCILLFAGDHSACDKWLDRNRGYTAAVDNDNRLKPVYTSEPGLGPESYPQRESAYTLGPLWAKLPEKLFERLVEGIGTTCIRDLQSLESISPEDELLQICENIEKTDPARAKDILDIFLLLRSDRITEARDTTKLALEEYRSLEQATADEEAAEPTDGQLLKRIDPESPTFQKLFDHFVRTANYKDWMLFMHPEQEHIARSHFAGSAKLTGVSGSGKTCIVIQRAVHLAEKYPDERVLVLTLNRSLARLIKDLLQGCAVDEVASRIDVQPFFAVCQALLKQFEPRNTKLYDDITWKSEEHIDEVWREYYRCELNNHDAIVMQRVHDSLISRGINAEAYIKEEFDWIRSAVVPTDREKYLDIARKGRTYPLEKSLRSELLEGLDGWERKMRHVGITDYLGIATALYPYLGSIASEYRCVLVDECQDFGTMELKIVRKLVPPGEDDVFIAGDAAQHVTPKHQRLREAGIEIPGARSLQINQNYRNSREVLTAAFGVLESNLTEEMLEQEDFDILDPEYANFSGPAPILLGAQDLKEEIASALTWMDEQTEQNPHTKGCVAICGHSLYEIQKFGERVRRPVLDRTMNLDQGKVFIADLEQTKGFEFDYVCILNVTAGVVPDIAMPEQERFRDLSRFYVAMTRAKTQLLLSYHGQPSSYLAEVDELFLHDSWLEYLGEAPEKNFGVPPRLRELRQHNVEWVDYRDMTAQQFLYTSRASGLPGELISKMRELIPGKRTTQGSGRNATITQWRSIDDAAQSFRKDARARQLWGPTTGKLFIEMAEDICIASAGEISASASG